MTENDGWLLILDNADDPQLLRRYLPDYIRGHILITSRARVFDMLGIAKSLDILELTEHEAFSFILQRTGRLNEDKPDHIYARELVKELGYLPLAIEQAGAYILTHQTLFKEYLESYKTYSLRLLGKTTPVSEDYKKTVNTTWALNFSQLEEQHPESAIALTLSAFFSPDNIPLDLLRVAYEMPEPGEAEPPHVLGNDPLALGSLLEPITRYSLIRRDIDSKTYSMHRLVQDVIKEWIPEEMQPEFALKVTRAVNEMFPDASYDTWPLCDQLLPHAMLGFNYVTIYGFTYLDAGNMLINAGAYLRIRTRYREAEQVHMLSVKVRQRDLGNYDAEVASALNDLAVVYYDQYQFDKAAPLFIEASQILQTAFGDEHPDLALTWNNLGMVYVRMEKFEAARPSLYNALELVEKTKKEEEPFYALILNNIGELHIGLGQYKEAQKFVSRSLAMREKISNPEKLLRSYNTVAWLMYKTGDMKESEQYFIKALSYAENIFGAEHPELIIILRRYSEYLLANNRNDEAESFQKRLDYIKKIHAITA
jgi:tetratricopeptide (TPR) repeat protein